MAAMGRRNDRGRSVGWGELMLLGGVPVLLGAVACACYAFGGPHRALLTDVAVAVAVPVFAACICRVVLCLVRLLREGRAVAALVCAAGYVISTVVSALTFLTVFMGLL